MELDTEHFLFWRVNEINAFILITLRTASRYSSKACIRVILSYFFRLTKEFNCILYSLLGFREFFHLKSEMFTDSLSAKTNTKKVSISACLNNLSYFLHFFICFIIDITWPTSEDENILLRFIISVKCSKMYFVYVGRASFSVIYNMYITSERCYHPSKCERKVITEIDNRYFFSNKFWTEISWII